MPYCSNCGSEISEKAKFCQFCGEKIEYTNNHKSHEETPSLSTQTITTSEKTETNIENGKSSVGHSYSLLNAGELFVERYRIIKPLEKDAEGSGYLVFDEQEKFNCHLKIFYQAYYDNINKLFGSHIRTSKLKSINHPNIAKVYEVNLHNNPSYVVSEYISGKTLAALKENNPDLFTEEFVRNLALTLTDAAQHIRRNGLSVQNLTLEEIAITDDNQIKIYSIGISYDSEDEREDIFNIGLLLAKLVTKNKFYNTLYNPIRMREKKFEYIAGVSISFNKILAECLHRTITQRYKKLSILHKALEELPPLEKDEKYQPKEIELVPISSDQDISTLAPRIDLLFWSIIVVTLILIVLMVTTNIIDTVFGEKETTFRFTGLENLMRDSTTVIEQTTIKPADSIRRVAPLRSIRTIPDGNDLSNTRNVTQSVTSAYSSSEIKRTIPQLTNRKSNPFNENMVFIPADTYAFGTINPEARDNVSINGFYISKTEVTQEEYAKYMTPPSCTSKGDNLPVDNVSWFDAIIYCNGRSQAEGLTPCYRISGSGNNRVVTCDFKANGYRLPTEAEWEYAARGKEFFPYSGSDDVDAVAWYRDNSGGRLKPVKSKKSNYFDVYDMTGNVSEWCWDWYDPNYSKVMPFINPTGPDFGTSKVVRGGNILHAYGKNLYVTNRDKADPNLGHKFIGFRVVRSK